MKIYLVMGGYNYDGAAPIYAASTQEKAEEWIKANWEHYQPYPNDKNLKKIWKWRCTSDMWFGDYDYINVESMPIDEENDVTG